MKILSFATTLMVISITANPSCANGYAKFERDLLSLIREAELHSAPWFFQKLSFNGDWHSTVLIYGYPDNEQACNSIARAAKVGSPNARFRCSMDVQE